MAVQGILELVTHLRTVEETFLWSMPVKALAVLGYFQSWVRELLVEDMVVAACQSWGDYRQGGVEGLK